MNRSEWEAGRQRATQLASAIGIVLSVAFAAWIYIVAESRGEASAPIPAAIIGAVIGLMLTSIAMAIGDSLYCYRHPEPPPKATVDPVSVSRIMQIGPGGDPLFMIPPNIDTPPRGAKKQGWKLTESATWD